MASAFWSSMGAGWRGCGSEPRWSRPRRERARMTVSVNMTYQHCTKGCLTSAVRPQKPALQTEVHAERAHRSNLAQEDEKRRFESVPHYSTIRSENRKIRLKTSKWQVSCG